MPNGGLYANQMYGEGDPYGGLGSTGGGGGGPTAGGGGDLSQMTPEQLLAWQGSQLGGGGIGAGDLSQMTPEQQLAYMHQKDWLGPEGTTPQMQEIADVYEYDPAAFQLEQYGPWQEQIADELALMRQYAEGKRPSYAEQVARMGGERGMKQARAAALSANLAPAQALRLAHGAQQAIGAQTQQQAAAIAAQEQARAREMVQRLMGMGMSWDQAQSQANMMLEQLRGGQFTGAAEREMTMRNLSQQLAAQQAIAESQRVPVWQRVLGTIANIGGTVLGGPLGNMIGGAIGGGLGGGGDDFGIGDYSQRMSEGYKLAQMGGGNVSGAYG